MRQLSLAKVSGRALPHLMGLKKLASLNLYTADVRDEDLTALTDLPALERLDLSYSRSKLTDAGMMHLGKLVSLRRLALNGAAITDKGLAPLAKLTELEYLSLAGTKGSSPALAALVGGKQETRADEKERRPVHQHRP